MKISKIKRQKGKRKQNADNTMGDTSKKYTKAQDQYHLNEIKHAPVRWVRVMYSRCLRRRIVDNGKKKQT